MGSHTLILKDSINSQQFFPLPVVSDELLSEHCIHALIVGHGVLVDDHLQVVVWW